MQRVASCAIWLLVGLFPVGAQTIHDGWKWRPSPHITGADGLSGWTLDYRLPDESAQYKGEYEPMTLVIARNGHEIRRIEGQPFVWDWTFWNDGRQVAVARGPKHFALFCSLFDVKTGRELQRVDCYSQPPKNAPAWVRAVAN